MIKKESKVITCFIFISFGLLFQSCSFKDTSEQQVFNDDFSSFEPGIISPPVGPHTEYHFLKEAQLKGNWKVTSFYFSPRGADTAWSIVEKKGKKSMRQSITNRLQFTHPMISAGNSLWKDYSVEVKMTSEETDLRSGLIFRYHNDRQYYFFGLDKNEIKLIVINHETAFHTPSEKILGNLSFEWVTDTVYSLRAEARGDLLKTYLNNKLVFEVNDTTFRSGKIALMSDSPAFFNDVIVKTSSKEIERIKKEEQLILSDERRLQSSNPKLVLWKKISTAGFGVGRNLRFGDLDNDGKKDVLIGQVIHHAYPRDSYSELSCLTAMTFDGKKLWQIGTPSPHHQSLTNDVAFQIYDINNDGKNEVIYTMNCELIIADGKTGKTIIKSKTPEKRSIQYDEVNQNKIVKEWTNILGDCLFFCDLRGIGRPSDIVIKDRYSSFWVLDEKLNIQWSSDCRTGHYPYSKDIDNDGKEELFIGYSVFNYKGELIWTLENKLKDHCDGIGVVNFNEKEGSALKVFIASSDQGAVLANTKGEIIKIHLVGHVQNPAVANFRSDLQGLETVSINFWGSQGIIHFFNSEHDIYYDFEPTSYGSMCLPINWTGKDEEFFVLNANIKEGGMFDGWGRRVVLFPDDGHPDMCYAVLDLTGDARDEIVVWDPDELWIYTQNDSPLTGNIYKPKRNPLYNYSNYQLTISEKGWNTD
jgi:rhamnogalacturonan endolyase